MSQFEVTGGLAQGEILSADENSVNATEGNFSDDVLNSRMMNPPPPAPPVIWSPFNGQVLDLRPVDVFWNFDTDVTYTISLSDMTTMQPMMTQSVGMNNHFTIPQRYFRSGHQYQVTVIAQRGFTASLTRHMFTIQSAAVACPPLADVRRGTAAQYLAMGIGWPLGNVHGIENRSINQISSWFGSRNGTFHLGIDIVNPGGGTMGTPILAVVDGTVAGVTLTNRGPGTEGFSISIRANHLIDPVTRNQLIFTYHHLREAPSLRVVGTPVRRGQIIGFVGNSGAEATSNGHLHFEVSNSGTVWGPDGGATASQPNRRRWHRVSERVNPRFFFSADAFIGNTAIWNEIRGNEPSN